MPRAQNKIVEQNKNDIRIQYLSSGEEKRVKIQQARQAWMDKLPLANKKAILFEFEMLLLGIDRFFQEAKHPSMSMGHLITRDFSKEINILYDSIGKVVHLCNVLLNQSDRTFPFRQFVGAKTQDENLWREEMERGLAQDSPIDSLFFLCSGFKSYSVLLESLMQGYMIPFHAFEHLGFLINREMGLNVHFNPQQFVQFTPLYDRINSDLILNFIKSLKSETTRKNLSVILLVHFRILNYLKFVPRPCAESNLVKKALVIFSLISTEIKNLAQFIEQLMPEIKDSKSGDGENAIHKIKMISTLEIMEKRLLNEHDRVYQQELKAFTDAYDFHQSTNSIEICHSILLACCQQNVVDCVQVFDKKLTGADIFPNYFTPYERSHKLRHDLFLFHKILDAFGVAIKSETQSIAPIFRCILEYAEYFETVQFPALRFLEYKSFKEFTGKIWGFSNKIRNKNVLHEDVENFKTLIQSFQPYIQSTIQEIEKRGELQEKPVNTHEIDLVFNEYMKRFQKGS